MQESDSENTGDYFPKTSTSMYHQIASRDPDISRAGQERFYRDYTPLMQKYLIILGCKPEDAADDVQDFIHRQLRGKEKLKAWDPKIGKLRGFLRARLRNHWIDRIRKDQAQKRGGDLEKLSIDHPDYQESGELNPEDESRFDLLWSRQKFDEAKDRTKSRYLAKGKVREFELLFANLDGRSGNRPRISQAQIGEELGCSANTVAAKMTTFRAVFISQLRGAVADTVAVDLIEEELRHIRENL